MDAGDDYAGGCGSEEGRMKIMVALSIAHHPLSGREMRSPNDGKALEIALSLEKLMGAEIKAVHVGKESAALREYLGLGIRQISLISPSGRDTAELLTGYAQQEKTDIILTGSRGQESSGLVPYLMAHSLVLPLFHNVLSLAYKEDTWEVTQFLPGGKRRKTEFSPPVILMVHPKAGLNLQYAWSRERTGEVKPYDLTSVSARGADEGWQYARAETGRKRLSIASQRSGFERLQKAISLGERGGEIIKEGDAAAKAEKIMTFLQEKRLL